MDEDTKQEDFITTEFMVTSIIPPIIKTDSKREGAELL